MSDHGRKQLRVLPGAPAPGPFLEVDRRRFLSLVGASLALAKATACSQQPPEALLPYVRQPENVLPGVPSYYATSFVQSGYAMGLLGKTLTGRPIKLDGNPEHPASLGATDAFAQASVLMLYDPDRAQAATRLGRITTWPRIAGDLAHALAAERASGGAGIRVLTETVTSPSLIAEMGGFLAELPNARWSRYEPAGDHHARLGAQLALGRPANVVYDLGAADTLLTIDSDLLAEGPGALRYAFQAARRRAPDDSGALGHTAILRGPPPASPGMSRMYCVESWPTCTSTISDHRLALRPSEVGVFTAALAEQLGVAQTGGALGAVPPMIAQWASAIARALRATAGRCVIAAGEPAAPAVHALAIAMNDALGNTGRTVFYTDPVEAEPVNQIAQIQELAADMRAGRVRLLIILGANPVYTAPADIDFAAAMKQVPLCAQLSLYRNETTEHCHYHVPEAHFLEAWGDARAFDGTASLIQPLIEPLYAGKTALEVIAALRGRPEASGREIVKAYWQARVGGEGFEATWLRAVELGFWPLTALPARPIVLVPGAAQLALSQITAALPGAGYELAIRTDPTVGDGRFANVGWLQELPKPHTKLTWDNAAVMSPKTAAELGVVTGDLVQLAREGRAVTAPVYVLRGHPDSTVTVHLGYGRRRGGNVGRGLGFDAYRLRTSDALWHARGLSIRKLDGHYPLAVTQGDFDTHGRPHVRTAPLATFLRHPDIIDAMNVVPHAGLSLYPEWEYNGRAWGMSVDQGICTGCSACVVACQAENNIPVVGKGEVLAGREMHWLRIDRYEVETGAGSIVVNQPMLCVHCEKAPCEVVCPVEATTHSAEGLNEMTYNRCVGTRYCQNNCPYKVRRFNFFDYTDPANTLKLLRNNEVTVRSRGVMEKCTYCVQRIVKARIAAEIEGSRPIRDGEVVTACQDACPTGAIAFGDINDPASRVRRLKLDPRSYGVLSELNTQPRTTHMARLRNLDPELVDDG